MNKKKRIAILFAVILVVAVGIIIAVTSHQKKEMDFDEFADRFEKSAEEVLGEDVKKVTKTELAATLTYGDQTDKDRTIYYRILKTTFYDGDPAEITGLHTEALGVLFPVDSMDSCEEMMIKDWYGALYKKDDKAFLCWTYSPEITYVLEYDPNKIDDSEIIKMAESAEVEKKNRPNGQKPFERNTQSHRNLVALSYLKDCFVLFAIFTSVSITGTSVSTPTVVASAAGLVVPNRATATATDNSKKLDAPIIPAGAEISCGNFNNLQAP